MKKLNEYTRKRIDVTEIATIFRKSDSVAYSVYKDNDGTYYMDAYDGAASIAQISECNNDSDAIASAQEILDSQGIRDKIVEFLEETCGSLEYFPEQDLHVDAFPFCNDEMDMKNVRVVCEGDSWDIDELYGYVIDGDKLYKAYFSTKDEDGNAIDLDNVDYKNAYKIKDVTDIVLDF